MLPTLISFLLAGLCEGMAVWQLRADATTIYVVIGWHLAATVISIPGWRRIFPAPYAQARWTFAALVLGLAGTLPIAGFLLLAGVWFMLTLKVTVKAEKDYVFGTRQYLTVVRHEELSEETPRSILDILHGASPEARRNAILALRDVEAKKALPLLQKAIQDSDEQVRLMAQTMFTKIIANLEIKIKQLEAELVKPPHPLPKLIQLAEQYHELVYLGLSSDETQRIHLDRAIELLLEAAPHAPNNPAIPFLLMRCYLRNENVTAARACLQQLQARGWGETLTIGWEAEIHFLERDWHAVARCMNQLQVNKATAPALRDVADFWMSGIPLK